MTVLKTYELFWSKLKIYDLFSMQNLCQNGLMLLVYIVKIYVFLPSSLVVFFGEEKGVVSDAICHNFNTWALDFLQQNPNECELNCLVLTCTLKSMPCTCTISGSVVAVLAPATTVKTYAKEKTYELLWSRLKTYEVLRPKTYLIP